MGKKRVLLEVADLLLFLLESQYHEWMKDPQLQEQTASEPLSLKEEFEMQTSWHLDPDSESSTLCLHSHLKSPLFPSSDFLCFYFHGYLTGPELTFIVLERESTEEALPSSIEELLESSKMAGDVNLFLNQVEIDEEEDGNENSGSKERTRETRLEAECEVMIAGELFSERIRSDARFC